MNFLWDIVIRARNNGISESEIFIEQAEEYSPFYEQAFTHLDETEVISPNIEINLLLRFAYIFQRVLAIEEPDYQNFYKYLIDMALHTILYVDLRHGLTKRDIYVYKILEELEDGTFWKEGALDFKVVPTHLKHRIATLVLNQAQTGSSLLNFRRSLVVLFPHAVLYQIRKDRKKLILYLSDQKTKEKEQQIQFIQDFFLPYSYRMRIFWEYHFGVIGVDEAMEIDKIAIY